MASYGAWKVLGVLVLAAISASKIVEVADYCEGLDDGYYCATCLHVVYCSDGESFLLETCLYEVCEERQGYSACVPMEEATQCHCTNTIQCDNFNPDYVSKCNDEGMYDVLACDDEEQTCSGGKCGSQVPGVYSCDDVGGLTSEWYFITPDCTQGFYCYDNGDELPVQCEANEYIDANGNCLAAPPQPCASGCTGPCSDNLDCTRYYLCDGAGTVVDTTQCPEGEYFDPNAEPVPMCQKDETKCAPLTFCDFDVIIEEPTTTTTTTTTSSMTTTTTTTSTPTYTQPPCDSEGDVGNYPAGPCSSSYWSCRNMGGGNYGVLLQQCSNDLIFDTDPTSPYCDLPENVDTCT